MGQMLLNDADAACYETFKRQGRGRVSLFNEIALIRYSKK